MIHKEIEGQKHLDKQKRRVTVYKTLYGNDKKSPQYTTQKVMERKPTSNKTK